MRRLLYILLLLLATVLLVLLLRGCAVTSCLIPSTGMENTLRQGERILVNKWSYGLRLPGMAWWGYRRWRERPVGRGDVVVFNNPANHKEPLISRRETYIGRCIGLPGDTLWVDSLFVVHRPQWQGPDAKSLYRYPRRQQAVLDTLLRRLAITTDAAWPLDSLHLLRSFSRYEYYLLQQASTDGQWLQPWYAGQALPLHPLVVPRRGVPVEVHPWNVVLLCNTLLLHEHRKAALRGDSLLLDGKPVSHCRFSKDYHWVVTDNAANTTDSRRFGLVPKDHFIGRAFRLGQRHPF